MIGFSQRFSNQLLVKPKGVGLLPGAADSNALIVNGCTSVQPYKCLAVNGL